MSYSKRDWSLDDEIKLLNLVCDYKPAGKQKHKNMVMIIDNINKGLTNADRPFTASEIWEKLETLYNLPKLDALEDFRESEADEKKAKGDKKHEQKEKSPSDKEEEGDKSPLKNKKRVSIKEKGKKIEDSPALSDVESGGSSDGSNSGETSDKETSAKPSGARRGRATSETATNNSEDESDQEDETKSRRITRGLKKTMPVEKTRSERNRSRSAAKLDGVLSPAPAAKRRSSKAVTPPAPSTSKVTRRTRSGVHNEDKNENYSDDSEPSKKKENNDKEEDKEDEDSGEENDEEKEKEHSKNKETPKDKDKASPAPEAEPPRSTRRSTRSSGPAPTKITAVPIRRSTRKK